MTWAINIFDISFAERVCMTTIGLSLECFFKIQNAEYRAYASLVYGVRTNPHPSSCYFLGQRQVFLMLSSVFFGFQINLSSRRHWGRIEVKWRWEFRVLPSIFPSFSPFFSVSFFNSLSDGSSTTCICSVVPDLFRESVFYLFTLIFAYIELHF